MNVAFVSENTLGHVSYLPPFVAELLRRVDLGITPILINAVPLPPRLQFWGDTTIPLLRRWGLDLGFVRWRWAASRNVLEQVAELRKRTPLDAIVVNTQSVALLLAPLAREIPLLICLDQTFHDLIRSPWLSPAPMVRSFLRPFLRGICVAERQVLSVARRRLAWSESVQQSLTAHYGFQKTDVNILPPSLPLPPLREVSVKKDIPQLLFIGGDYARKGGALLRETFERHYSSRATLHLVTRSEVSAGPNIFVHRNVQPGSAQWRSLWNDADALIFPSSLETFGIVMVEALGFMVPVIATDTGAAREVLEDGKSGWLIPEATSTALAAAIEEVLLRTPQVIQKVERGRRRFETAYELRNNTERLAEWLRSSAR